MTKEDLDKIESKIRSYWPSEKFQIKDKFMWMDEYGIVHYEHPDEYYERRKV